MKRKIKNSKGASLLIALVVFLAASMVSVVIISASLTTIKRVKDDRADKEEYLAVSSAARYFSSKIANTECKRTLDSVDDKGKPHYTYSPGDTDNGFGTLLSDMLQKAEDPTSPSTDNTRTLTLNTLNLDGTVDADLKGCQIELTIEKPTMGADVDITDSNGDKSYSITGTVLPLDVTEDITYRRVYFNVWLTSKTTSDNVTTYKWGGVTMSTRQDDLQ